MIAHPTCTYLCNSGVRWLHTVIRHGSMCDAANFFNKLREAQIPHIAVENPIPHRYARRIIGKYDQIIQPWMFGHMEQKATCLWLKDLPKLIPTRNVRVAMMRRPVNQRQRIHYLPPSKTRWKIRSKTFTGIAVAMAQQWSTYINERHLSNQ
jgi:creatinine amidohydrolase/Fe(II)-dependent formamide hydrolase-like protein